MHWNKTAAIPGRFPANASIAVIGAGIIGITSAISLAKLGYRVCIYDPHSPGRGGPSRGNAGHIASSDIFPLSTPGIGLTALKMLVKKQGSLKIPGFEKIRMLPWFLAFLATSRNDRFEQATRAIIHLSQSSIDELESMLHEAGASNLLNRCECAFLYDRATSFEKSRAGWKEKARAGFDSEIINTGKIPEHFPELNPTLSHAVFSKQWAVVRDPLEIVGSLAEYALSIGVEFRQKLVKQIEISDNGIIAYASGMKSPHNAAVIAAGVHSKHFADALGEKLPLAAERGYNLTFPNASFELKFPIVFPDRGIVATQLSSGLRIGGWAEYASPDRPENPQYYETLSTICQELFPALDQSNAKEWMGQRPSLPDSVPVISRSTKTQRVLYNCGHGHYGLTHCAVSARILGEIIKGNEISSTNSYYSIDRFN